MKKFGQFNFTRLFNNNPANKPYYNPNKTSLYEKNEKDKIDAQKSYDGERHKLSPTKLIFEKIHLDIIKEKEENPQNQKKLTDDEKEQLEKESKGYKFYKSDDPFRPRLKEHYRLNKKMHDSTLIFNYTKLEEADNFIKKKHLESNEEYSGIFVENNQKEEEDLVEIFNSIVNKIGYLDYRDYLVLNKFVVDEKVNESNIATIKKDIISLAIQLANKKQRKLIKATIDDVNKTQNKDGSKIKREDRFMSNIELSKELFEKYYHYKRKKALENDFKEASLTEKINELRSLNDKKNKNLNDYNTLSEIVTKDPILDDEDFGFSNDIDKMVKNYRAQRLKPLKTNMSRILKIVSDVFNLRKVEDEAIAAQTMNEEELDLLKKKKEVDESISKLVDKKEVKTVTQQLQELIISGQLKAEDTSAKGGKKKEKEPEVQRAVSAKKNRRGSYSSLRRNTFRDKDEKLKYIPRNKRLHFSQTRNQFLSKPPEKLDCDFDKLEEDPYYKERFFLEQDPNIIDVNSVNYKKNKDDIFLLMKYLIIIEKLGVNSIYTPTNMETERRIYNYLRSKLENKTFGYKPFTPEEAEYLEILYGENTENKKVEIEKFEDPFLKKLIEENERLRTNSTEEEKEKFKKEFHQIKENYFKSKSEYKRKQLLEKFDRLYANQFGFQFADEKFNEMYKNKSEFVRVNNKTFPLIYKFENYDQFTYHKDLVKEIVKNYYREYKMSHMYNLMDFYTDKYRIRRKILENVSNRSSLEEINISISKFAEKLSKSEDFKLRYKMNLFDYKNSSDHFSKIFHILENKNNMKNNEQSSDHFLNQNYDEKTVKVLKEHMSIKPVLPKIIEEHLELNKGFMNNSDSQIINEEMEKKSKNLEINQYDRFELDVYKSLKRDPFYTHYINNFLSFQCDQANNFKELLNIREKSKAPLHQSSYVYKDTTETLRVLKNMGSFNEFDMERYYNIAKKTKNEVLLEKKDEINFKHDSELFEGQKSFDELIAEKKNFVYRGFGKRKTSHAWAFIKPGTGVVTINRVPIHHYLKHEYLRSKVLNPLIVSGTCGKLDVNIIVYGGGFIGQTDAIIPAISIALAKLKPDFEETLKNLLLIFKDPRNVERKKPGLQKARKGQVYRRR